MFKADNGESNGGDNIASFSVEFELDGEYCLIFLVFIFLFFVVGVTLAAAELAPIGSTLRNGNIPCGIFPFLFPARFAE